MLTTLVFGLDLCFAGIGGVHLILCGWYCRQSQFPTGLHGLSADGVQGYPVIVVFDKEKEGVLCLLEVFIKTDSDCLVGKLRLCELSSSFGSGQVQPFHVRFGVLNLVHS